MTVSARVASTSEIAAESYSARARMHNISVVCLSKIPACVCGSFLCVRTTTLYEEPLLYKQQVFLCYATVACCY